MTGRRNGCTTSGAALAARAADRFARTELAKSASATGGEAAAHPTTSRTRRSRSRKLVVREANTTIAYPTVLTMAAKARTDAPLLGRHKLDAQTIAVAPYASLQHVPPPSPRPTRQASADLLLRMKDDRYAPMVRRPAKVPTGGST